MANPIRTLTELPVRTIQAVTGGEAGEQQVRETVTEALRPLLSKVDAMEKELSAVRKELRKVREDTDHIRTVQARNVADTEG